MSVATNPRAHDGSKYRETRIPIPDVGSHV